MKKVFAYTTISQVVLLAIAQSAIANEQIAELDEVSVISSGSMYKMGEVPFHQAKSAVAVTREELDNRMFLKQMKSGVIKPVFQIRYLDQIRIRTGSVCVENRFRNL